LILNSSFMPGLLDLREAFVFGHLSGFQPGVKVGLLVLPAAADPDRSGCRPSETQVYRVASATPR
jgi:hypothetical protein